MTLKRAFDIAVASTGLIALSPVFAVVAASTAIAFKGSPFHVAERLGKDRQTFGMIKFRSMTNARDENGAPLPDQQRRTFYGHMLRVTSVDELPQLVNILKGDMSFVGPRPRSPELSRGERIPEGYEDILSVRPGLTGLWQVAVIGRPSMGEKRRAALDAAYVRSKPSLAQDVSLMMRSLPSMVRGHNGETMSSRRHG